MKKIAYTNSEGGVSIMVAVPREKVEEILGPMTDEDYEQRIWGRIPDDATNAVEIDDDAIPRDQEFRNAWKQNGNEIEHDLPKAKEIQLDRIRHAREPKFLALDVEFLQALEKGEDTTSIIAEKQSLRDMTEPLKALEPKSIDDIKNAWPDDMPQI